MAITEGMRDLLLELFAPMGPVKIRRMFSGAGLFLDGTMFALVIDDALFLKADVHNRPMLEAEGMGPFVYTRQQKEIALSFWRAPERLLDEPEEMLVFARAALNAARRAATAKTAKPAPNKPAPKRKRKAA